MNVVDPASSKPSKGRKAAAETVGETNGELHTAETAEDQDENSIMVSETVHLPRPNTSQNSVSAEIDLSPVSLSLKPISSQLAAEDCKSVENSKTGDHQTTNYACLA